MHMKVIGQDSFCILPFDRLLQHLPMKQYIVCETLRLFIHPSFALLVQHLVAAAAVVAAVFLKLELFEQLL